MVHYEVKKHMFVGHIARTQTATRGTMKQRNEHAFTIIELIVVVVVIAIIATISVVSYTAITNNAQITTLKADLQTASSQLKKYKADTSAFPASLSLVETEPSDGVTFEYTYNSIGKVYCLTAARSSGVAYHISDGAEPTEGPCLGHTGNVASKIDCPSGFISVPGNAIYKTDTFCVMKYEAKQASATVPVSQAAGTPWVSITQTNAAIYSENVAGCTGCHLITEAEWLTIAANVMSVASNWSGGSVGSGAIFRGHNDNSPASSLAASTDDSDGYSGTGQSSGDQRRTHTLSNGEVIWDIAGNVNEWTQGGVEPGQSPGIIGEVSLTWKDWNDASLNKRGLQSMAYPSYASELADTWTSTQGVGRLYSNHSDGTAKKFARGGGWISSTNTGPFTINAGNVESIAAASIGFRVAK